MGKDFASVMIGSLDKSLRDREQDFITEQTLRHSQGRNPNMVTEESVVYSKDAFMNDKLHTQQRLRNEREARNASQAIVIQPNDPNKPHVLVVKPNE